MNERGNQSPFDDYNLSFSTISGIISTYHRKEEEERREEEQRRIKQLQEDEELKRYPYSDIFILRFRLIFHISLIDQYTSSVLHNRQRNDQKKKRKEEKEQKK